MQLNYKIYQERLKAIRPFTNLKIKNRKNFTPSEKRMITIYYNELLDMGLIERDGLRYVQKVKFVQNKKSKIKGLPRVKGVFIQGAMPNDKINKKGQIVKGAYLKEFIPVIFPQFDIDNNGYEYIENILKNTFKNRTLKISDYFTIVLAGGWELGQNMRHTTPIKDRHHGRAYTKDHDQKIKELAHVIYDLLTTSVNRYKIKENLIIGLYLYTFKNQRQPTPTEKKAIRNEKTNKRKNRRKTKKK